MEIMLILFAILFIAILPFVCDLYPIIKFISRTPPGVVYAALVSFVVFAPNDWLMGPDRILLVALLTVLFAMMTVFVKAVNEYEARKFCHDD
jgi:ABC-type Na+ efflux pump permease subunit